MTIRSTPTPSSTSRSRMRSWVIGRWVTTPCKAKAIAVASTAPMKIGSTRWSPSASRNNTIGLLVGSSTRTPTRCISTTKKTLPLVQGVHVCVRVGAKGVEIARDHPVQVAVTLLIIEAVTEHEVVLDLEADVVDRGGNDAANGLVQQGASDHRPRSATLQLAQEVGEGEAGVDDVLDEDDVPTGHVQIQVLDDADPARVRGVMGDRHEVDFGHDGHGPGHVGQEGNAALENGNQDDPVGVGRRELPCQPAHALGQLAGRDQRAKT